MIIANTFKGVIAFSSFLSDFKSRGHTVNPILYIGLVFTWMFVLVSAPLFLFLDLILFLVKMIEVNQPKKKYINNKKKGGKSGRK